MNEIKEDKPLPEHTKLNYDECYAKIVLEESFPDQFFDLEIRDKPDLQNEQLNIGIEVTSSIDPKQKESESLYVKWFEQSNDGKEKIERQIEKCGAQLKDGLLRGVLGNDNFNRIYAEIKRKKEKVGKYRSFNKQYLFIFSYILATSDMREKALKEMHHICFQTNPKFDGIYVLVPGELYIFDFIKNITFEKKINSNMQYMQACRAREMVMQGEQTTK